MNFLTVKSLTVDSPLSYKMNVIFRPYIYILIYLKLSFNRTENVSNHIHRLSAERVVLTDTNVSRYLPNQSFIKRW